MASASQSDLVLTSPTNRIKREIADRLYTVFSDGPPLPHMLGEWSSWVHILSPTEHEGFKSHDQTGYCRCDWKNVSNEDKDKFQYCGVYELMIKKSHSLNKVVYIGCITTQCKGRSPLNFIEELLMTGVHTILNSVVAEGYDVYARVEPTGTDIDDTGNIVSQERAQNRRNQLLKVYDYAWNESKSRPLD